MTMAARASEIASLTSGEVMVRVLGRPSMVSRPRISMESSLPLTIGRALPIWSLISSAVRSPMMRLWRRRT
jgi:hypothetical protein